MVAGQRRDRRRHARRREYRARAHEDEDEDEYIDTDNGLNGEWDDADVDPSPGVQEAIRQSLLETKGGDAADPIEVDDLGEVEKKTRKYRKRIVRSFLSQYAVRKMLITFLPQGRDSHQ